MLNLLTSSQTREADQFTIVNKPISSIELMEEAAKAFLSSFWEEVPYTTRTISIYCGTGNNGGDGLAIARLLHDAGYDVNVKIVRFGTSSTEDFSTNYKRITSTAIPVTEITNPVFPEENSDFIIDAIIGAGLNKALSGDFVQLAKHINSLNKKVIAVDAPTGFNTEGIINPGACYIKADKVITFQRPKINFFFPESEMAMNSFEVVDIGLVEDFIQLQESNWKLVEHTDIRQILKARKQFSHKGTFGHTLIIAGRKETMGAAILAAGACVYTGAGLTTACIPESGLTALNSRYPEVMALLRNENFTSGDTDRYSSIAAGPGLGTDKNAIKIVETLLETKKPLLLDADALNILARTPALLKKIPAGSIITPHLKEFDRLFGEHKSWWERLQTAQDQAAALKVIIVLKNRYTFIVHPDRRILINPTGSPSMATGGMGDVLTGMIASFFAQGYSSSEAAVLGCYVHGLCGQNDRSFVSPPSTLIASIPVTIKSLLNGDWLSQEGEPAY